MKYIIEFYKELDTVNLIVFWGTIIVVILLLTFSIILANKNKKLKYIIKTRGLDNEDYDYDEELAIKKDVQKDNSYLFNEQIENNEDNNTITNNYYSNKEETPVIKNIEVVNHNYYVNETKNEIPETKINVEKHQEYHEEKKNDDININQEVTKNINIENHHVYNEVKKPDNNEEQPVIKNVEVVNHNYYAKETKNEIPETRINVENHHVSNENHRFKPEELVMDNENSYTKELNRVKDEYRKEQLENSNKQRVEYGGTPRLSKTTVVVEEEKRMTPTLINHINEHEKNQNYESINEKPIIIPQVNSVQRQKEIAEEIKKQERREDKPKGNYLEEISKSLSKITKEEGINRTEYEIEQEENAIISYKELMEKKDSIQTIDEEDAVISIEELIEKKKQQEKLYNITNDSEDDKFIDELKNFRSDL